MNQEQSNLDYQLKFYHGDRLNSNYKNSSVIEKAYSNSIINRKDCNNISEKEIVVGLGFIILLLFLNSWQLYRSFNIGSIKQASKSEKTFIEKTVKPELEPKANYQKIELLTIQNMISNSNF